jgi:glycosyltransferase involved in cell wall biosynthesis
MARLALDVRSLAQPFSSFARVVRLIQAGAEAVNLELELWDGGDCTSEVLWTPHAEIPPVTNQPKLIITVHDINPLLGDGRGLLARLRHASRYRRKVRKISQQAWCINTGSRDAAMRLQQAFPALSDPVVTPWFAAEAYQPLGAACVDGAKDQQELKALGLEPGYLLYLGALRPHKNWRLALESYAALTPSLRSRHPLVMVGRRHRAAVEADRLASKLGIAQEVEWRESLPDTALPALYRQASLFLFPSLAEGFGLPPLEAQACGVPVLAARATSLPEVLGDGALLLDPHDPSVWTSAMAHILTAPEAAQEWSQKGRANASRYSAQRLGAAVLDMLP